MSRDVLIAILGRAAHADASGSRFVVRPEHELTVYFGEPARAMSVDHVVAIELAPTHVEVEVKERGTLYAPYDAVHAVLDAPTRARRGGGVGF
jgi:hypothetical protein